jgi:hypothetical protein
LRELASEIENMPIEDQLELVKKSMYTKQFDKASMFLNRINDIVNAYVMLGIIVSNGMLKTVKR